MKFKTVGDKINFVIGVLLGILVLYGVASAVGIGRWVGSNSTAGSGISIHQGGSKDTVWVLQGYGLTFIDSFLVVDTTTLKGLFVTPYILGDSLGGYLPTATVQSTIHDSLNANWATWLDGNASEGEIHDSLNAHWTLFTTGGGADIHDSIWHATFWDTWGNPSFRTGNPSGALSIFFPLSNDSATDFIRYVNEGTSADQVDTTVLSGFLPVDFPDIESVTYNMRSIDTDTLVSGLRVRILKRTAEFGTATAIYTGAAVASSGAGAWRHITIAGASIDAIAGGNEIEIRFVGLADAGKVVDHKKPRIWYQGR